MSFHAIQKYLREVERTHRFGGTKKETTIRTPFVPLLNEYAKAKNLFLVTEVSLKGPKGNTITPDGTLKDALQLDWGFWESKDEKDDLNAEIEKKLDKGYPKDNILFEDGATAVLIQGGTEVLRVTVTDEAGLDNLLKTFVGYERPEVRHFRDAIERFKADIPQVAETIRGIIVSSEKTNPKFQQALSEFLELCQQSINPEVSKSDVQEMLLQHILTEDIFNTIFDETQFHRENNIARELQKVLDTFFSGNTRRVTLATVQDYYKIINARAAQIQDHGEKQKFLKVVYEVFYKAYNPKAADRLGIVYTPNEVVNFMIESTDFLLERHFNRALEDRGVEILDPATGTGTFITDLINYLRADKLEYKYQHEIHANEVAILPYYVANLNIEFTFKQRMGRYGEFGNLCFVDTLDNLGFNFKSKQGDLFGVSAENAERIKRQNERKISVVIGNPPYNANQLNENDNNKNREYPKIDQRIKDTYIKHSTAQKTKVYDMYARFYRWAMDRLGAEGIIAFVTNRSFIDSRTFDGFRKCVADEFSQCYIIDLKSDVRANPKISGTAHNVFGIQTGVAIAFMVRQPKEAGTPCKIQYIALEDDWRKEEKLDWLNQHPFREIPFETIRPDKKHNWINLPDESDWETLLPVADKNVKLGRGKQALFELFSLGVVTNRDEWVYDFDSEMLMKKISYFVGTYQKEKLRWTNSNKNLKINDFVDRSIKWTEELEQHLKKGSSIEFNLENVVPSIYRPFIRKNLYFSRIITHRIYKNEQIFGFRSMFHNLGLYFSGPSASKPFQALATNKVAGLDFLEKTQCLPLYRYDQAGNRYDNLTDWGLGQFRAHYGDAGITKEAVFAYVYAVLYNPAYREKYALNLKRDFPRIPFYTDFWRWADWGQRLLDLHVNFEQAEPYPLSEHETGKPHGKALLKADREQGIIHLDTGTFLSGVPASAWAYKLGNRSALDWVLDQYKEGTPKDPTIREKFNTYRFADHKAHVGDLLRRVCTVSVETMRITEEMINLS